ncbi:MAG: DUF4091 domain-containing protein [Treponema sp.]|jgi:hypothetical protein|nr:DUF4091 domain-containing protein [Treponema sp.]
MTNYEFFLTDSLEKVLPARRPRPIDDGKRIPVFPGSVPALQLVYCRRRSEKRPRFAPPFTLSVEGAPVAAVLREVQLVPADFPANERSDDGYLTQEPAMLPDLLTPLKGNTIQPQPDQYNAVWIDFPGIRAAQEGSYQVTIRAAPDGKALAERGLQLPGGAAAAGAEMHITLDVLGEALPPQKLLHTQWFHTDCLADYYKTGVFSEEHWRIIDAFMEPMLSRYGINTLLTPVFTPPLDTAVGSERPTVQLVDIELSQGAYSFGFGKLERWCGLCKKHGITHLEIAHFFSQWGAKKTPKIVAREKGVEKKIFGWDVAAGSPEYRKFLEQFIPALRRALEQYGYDKAHTFFHVSDEPHGTEQQADYQAAKARIADLVEGSMIIDALSDFSFYEKGILEHPVPANDAIRPFLEAKIPGLWTYYCVGQSYLVPNRFIALRSPRTRAMGVLMYYFNIAGFLQWGYNFYYSALSETLLDPYFKTGGLKNWPAGDPFLVYPGADGRPLSSIRGEVHRESLEDMRILALVEEKHGREAALRIIREGFAGELSFENYPQEAAFYTGLRERAAKLLGRRAE